MSQLTQSDWMWVAIWLVWLALVSRPSPPSYRSELSDIANRLARLAHAQEQCAERLSSIRDVIREAGKHK